MQCQPLHCHYILHHHYTGWAALDAIQREGERLRAEVQLAFQSTLWEKLGAVISQYLDAGQRLNDKVQTL